MNEFKNINYFNKFHNVEQDEKSQNLTTNIKKTYNTNTIQAKLNSKMLTYTDVMQFQGSIGNKATMQLLKNYMNTSSKVVNSKANEVVQKKSNNTGLPDNLKAGVENLSGISMDDVRVHYNSDKPAQVGALAYTQGTEIHVAPGQEKHLPHEAWHVVQQSQGRVRPTIQFKDINVNDDIGLEHEANLMGNMAKIHWNINNKPSQTNVIRQPVTQLVKSREKKHLTAQQMEAIREIRLRIMPPFPFRFAKNGDAYMSTVEADYGGFVQSPQQGVPDLTGTLMDTSTDTFDDSKIQTSVVSGSTYENLPTTSKRAITQSSVMDSVSPNAAAEALKLDCPTKRSWEWLHLVAFSIRGTHISSLSAQSMQLINRTNQPQQIKENLVLGSAETNTAMITYETFIKEIMKANPLWKLNLYVAADKEDRIVKNTKGQFVKIPLCKRIEYHFYFNITKHKVTAPIILTFNTQIHKRPSLSEYSEVMEKLRKFTSNTSKVRRLPHGIHTSKMTKLKH